jgi:hypothetical protein
MESSPLVFPVVAVLSLSAPVAAQSVVVDEGTFTVTAGTGMTGTERFTIRRAGVGGDAIMIANGVVRLEGAEGVLELRPLLEATPLDGASINYQLKVSGTDAEELSVRLAGRRYVSRIQTDAGEEEREFLARPGTHILEEGTAHMYYFLRDAREGATVAIIEPRTRKQMQFTVSGAENEEIRIGSVRIQARKVTYGTAGDTRSVWFDAQGRVLRVEVPNLEYVAVRQDLVG